MARPMPLDRLNPIFYTSWLEAKTILAKFCLPVSTRSKKKMDTITGAGSMIGFFFRAFGDRCLSRLIRRYIGLVF